MAVASNFYLLTLTNDYDFRKPLPSLSPSRAFRERDSKATADKPCIVAIDEFQTITDYPEQNLEALLRTYIQKCNNAWFVFSGSKRHMMGEIFSSPARPFYQSASSLSLKPIPLDAYKSFITQHFEQNNYTIEHEAIGYMKSLKAQLGTFKKSAMNGLRWLSQEFRVRLKMWTQPFVMQWKRKKTPIKI